MIIELIGTDSAEALHEAGCRAARRAIEHLYSGCGRALPQCIRIEKDHSGKPHGFADGNAVSVSVSHAYPYALASARLGGRFALGVDIERIRNFVPPTAHAFTTERERVYIHQQPSALQATYLTLAWTLKEATLKALGTGLRTHPQAVDISRVLEHPEAPLIGIEIRGIPYQARVRTQEVGLRHLAVEIALSTPGRILEPLCYGASRSHCSDHRRHAPGADRFGAR